MVQITNRKIILFFEQRPEMDIETTILKFIDIMETLQENMNKTLTNSNVLEILDNLKTMNTKIDRSHELSQFNISNHINELKRNMNEEIKSIMSRSIMENVEPVLRERFKEQHLAFANVTFDKITSMFDNKLLNINEISKSNKEILSSQNDKLNNLLIRFESSSNKGKMSENLVLNILKDIYPCAEISSVGQTKETGDILLLRTNKPKILIENKLWGRSVVQAEVVKFIRDIDVQKCCGIFLSQNGKITTKDNFEINIHNGNVLVYVHDVHNDPDKIKLAVDIVDHLKEKLDEYEDYNNDQDNISKEMLEYINVEYQNFVSSKSSLVKLAKEFNQKLIKQIEEIKMPSLENYLSSKYSFSSNKFICEFCSFVGKNQQSKSAHIRGCTERKRVESQKNKTIGEQIICIDVAPS